MAKKAKARKRRPVVSRRTSVTLRNPTKRGVYLLPGRYRIANIHTGRVFVGTHVATINKGKLRLAIFSLPKG